jgi:phage regulator Rha-like protein
MNCFAVANCDRKISKEKERGNKMADELITANVIESKIFTIRGYKVMIDRDLAELYGVELKALNQAVKRNIERFPPDFMFQLTQDEWDILRSQIVTANQTISKVRYLPYVFTEHGVLMLSNVLNSSRAIDLSIQIIRVFDKLRKYALEHTTQDTRIEELRKLLMLHIENNDNKFSEYDKTIKQMFRVLNNLIEKPKETKKIGFCTD